MVYREAERIRSAENTFSQDAFSRLPQPQTVRDRRKPVWVMMILKPIKSEDKCRLLDFEQGCQQMRIFAW